MLQMEMKYKEDTKGKKSDELLITFALSSLSSFSS